MFEGGVLPRVSAGGAAGMLGAPTGELASGAAACAEDVAGLLGSLAAGGALAGVVEGLLARLLVTAQNSDDEGEDSDADGVGSADGADDRALLAPESGGDAGGEAALVAAAEELRPVSLEEAGSSGLLGLGVAGLGELATACHRLAVWVSWGASLAAACLTACGELSTHPVQWGPDGRVSEVAGFEERRFNTTCLLSACLGVSRSRAGQIVDHGSALMDVGFNPTEAMEWFGVLDAAKASLVTRRLEGVPAPVALAVQERVLPQAPRRSVSQVGRDIERVLMETEPTGHAERVRVNASRRCVSRPRPADEGVSQVRLLLSTMDALLLDTTLDAIAGACVFPACQTPAERCDIDHLTAWSQGGTTGLDNLATLCQAHHRLKHTPGWALTRDQASGILSWYTPDKTVSQRHPNGTITRQPRKIGSHQHHAPGDVVPGDLSKQISPDILNPLNTALNNTSTESSPSASTRLATRGPQPGQKPGAYETTPYPKAAHTLGLAPLIDAAPPF